MRGLSKFSALGLLAGLLAAGTCRGDSDDDVLWWSVPETAKIHEFRDDGVSTLAEKGVDTARIRVTGGDIAGDVFLRLYADDGNGGLALSDAVYADVPNASSAPYYASLGEYGTSVYSFSIELGAWSEDDGFVGLALSTWSYTELTDYISSANTAFTPGGLPASVLVPESFMVPEPNAILLLMIGGALLALRRRRG